MISTEQSEEETGCIGNTVAMQTEKHMNALRLASIFRLNRDTLLCRMNDLKIHTYEKYSKAVLHPCTVNTSIRCSREAVRELAMTSPPYSIFTVCTEEIVTNYIILGQAWSGFTTKRLQLHGN